MKPSSSASGSGSGGPPMMFTNSKKGANTMAKAQEANKDKINSLDSKAKELKEKKDKEIEESIKRREERKAREEGGEMPKERKERKPMMKEKNPKTVGKEDRGSKPSGFAGGEWGDDN